MKTLKALFILLALINLGACKKDTEEPHDDGHDHTHEAQPGSLTIQFENMVDAAPLVFGTKYINPKLDTFKVSMFKYYISNIVVTKDDNSTYSESESFHLIDHNVASTNSIVLSNVPAGSYKSIKFTLGIDSARNNSGAQTGDLDPAKGMFWSWNTGYIMLKLEGTAPLSPDPNKKITYHVGGFSGANKTQRSYNISFNGSTANVSSTTSSMIHLRANVNELFKTPNLVDVSTNYIIHMPGTAAKNFADNYSDMITFHQIHN